MYLWCKYFIIIITIINLFVFFHGGRVFPRPLLDPFLSVWKSNGFHELYCTRLADDGSGYWRIRPQWKLLDSIRSTTNIVSKSRPPHNGERGSVTCVTSLLGQNNVSGTDVQHFGYTFFFFFACVHLVRTSRVIFYDWTQRRFVVFENPSRTKLGRRFYFYVRRLKYRKDEISDFLYRSYHTTKADNKNKTVRIRHYWTGTLGIVNERDFEFLVPIDNS